MVINSFLYFILKWPYQLTLVLIVFVARVIWNIEVWPRHSYVLKSFVPGKSDLDLSIYTNDNKKLKSFLKFYLILKKIIPFLGELAIYSPEIIQYLKKFDLNGFEISRDPILIKKFNLDVNKADNESIEKAFVYMLMLLINDFHKLKSNAKSRFPKWTQHFEQIKKSSFIDEKIKSNLEINKELMLFSIFSALVILSSSNKEPLQLRTRLRMYIDLLLDNSLEDRDRWLRPLISDSQSQFYVYFVEYLCHVEATRPQLEDYELKYIVAQVDWFILKMLKYSVDTFNLNEDISRIEHVKKDLLIFTQQHPHIDLKIIFEKLNNCLEILKNRLN